MRLAETEEFTTATGAMRCRLRVESKGSLAVNASQALLINPDIRILEHWPAAEQYSSRWISPNAVRVPAGMRTRGRGTGCPVCRARGCEPRREYRVAVRLAAKEYEYQGRSAGFTDTRTGRYVQNALAHSCISAPGNRPSISIARALRLSTTRISVLASIGAESSASSKYMSLTIRM